MPPAMRGRPIYDFALAVERVQAAVEVARSLPIPFTLTARAENLLYGRNDLDDTIRRLQAFEAAGADVLYAPGVHDLAHDPHRGVGAQQALQSGDGFCRPDADRSSNYPPPASSASASEARCRALRLPPFFDARAR